MTQVNKADVITPNELAVLKCLYAKSSSPREPLTTEINEISYGTGIRDNDDVLRALYTLEGRNLVAPHPEGDFTSNLWKITAVGKRAFQIMHN